MSLVPSTDIFDPFNFARRARNLMKDVDFLGENVPLGSSSMWPGEFLPSWAGPIVRRRFNEQQALQQQPSLGTIRVKVSETPESYKVIADMPGFKKENIKVHVDDDRCLTIQGERQQERVEESEATRMEERSYGSFMRTIRLPFDAETENPQASYDNGTLRLRFNKKEVPGKLISIE